MLKELDSLPSDETGFLGHNGLSLGVIVQYWRSFDHLEAYARSPAKEHFPAWTAVNKRMKDSRADVDIWHETYLVKEGQYEAVYSGMPPYGLGRVSDLVPVTGRRNEARAAFGVKLRRRSSTLYHNNTRGVRVLSRALFPLFMSCSYCLGR